MINWTVDEMTELKLVGIRIQCAADEYVHEIPKGFEQMKERCSEIINAKPHRLIGVYKPGDFSEEEDGYWVCAEVSELVDVPHGMVKLIVPPQRYFIIHHHGPVSEVWNTYNQSHQMITEEGYVRIIRAWHLEFYDLTKKPAEGIIDTDLYNVIL
jgi:predicted transcriptional regulator YdeE